MLHFVINLVNLGGLGFVKLSAFLNIIFHINIMKLRQSC